QIDEARAFGADAVLLVLGGVRARQGADLLAAARAAGLDVLVEVHSEAELERAAGLGATLIGINNRDLATLDVSLATAERLAPRASARHVTPEAAREIAQAVPGTALVGVFVDAPRASVEEIAARVGLSALQFHGDEDADYCRGWGWRTIKAIRARPGADLAALAARYPTDYLLLDRFVAGPAGCTG